MTNPTAYDAVLRQRGSLTVWFTHAAIAAWNAGPQATRGGQPCHSALTVATALTLRAVFRLALRQTGGLLGSILALPGLVLHLGVGAGTGQIVAATLTTSDVDIRWTVVAAFLMRMAQGTEPDITGFVIVRRLKRRFCARIFGGSFAFSQTDSSSAPFLITTIFNRTHLYYHALLSFPVLSMGASFLILRANALVRTAEFVSVSEAELSLSPRS